MIDKEISTRQAILLATIDCIEEHGLEQLTTRMIAEKADANIAAINYYFRTKDQLVEEALQMTITHMLEDVMATLQDESLPFRKALEDVFYYLIEGGRQWPGITTAHLYSVVVEKEYHTVSAGYLLQAFNRLLERARQSLPGQDAGRMRLLLADIFSAVMFSMLTPGFFDLDARYRPESEASCRRLAEHYAGMFYALLSQQDGDGEEAQRR
jgi:AcrR family transcriptional regulator